MSDLTEKEIQQVELAMKDENTLQMIQQLNKSLDVDGEQKVREIIEQKIRLKR